MGGLWECDMMSGTKPAPDAHKMSGLKSVDTMKVSSGMTTPSRPQTKNEKVSPGSVASLFGLGSCDGGSGGSGGGGGPGHGDGDPTFDREGRSMHWLNKALV